MTSQSIDTANAPWTEVLARALLSRTMEGAIHGRLQVETPRGGVLTFGGSEKGPKASMTLHSWNVLRRVALGWDLGFADSYIAGEWSTPDLPALLNFMCRNAAMGASFRAVHLPPILGRLRHALNRNTRRGSRRNIAAHYDLGNAFYAQWLDPGMMYSSGIYSSGDETLSKAQEAKVDRIAELLDLAGGEDVLEIGCGWGGLAERLALCHGCRVTALTLSSEQLAHARDRLDQTEAAARCAFRLQDYRDAEGAYDRIVSVEMMEAVGEVYWPLYFQTLRSRLRKDGIAVLQVITIGERYFEAYRRRPDFIQRYVFPGGMLPTPSIIGNEIGRSGLQLVSSERFGNSYARTLADWRARFRNNWPAIEALGFDARFKRMWDYYLCYCAAGFEAGVLDVGLYKVSHLS